jgi:HSP20 family protein
MNRLFDEAFRGFGAPGPFGDFGAGWPTVELSENDKEIRVTAELPGLDEKDIEIDIAGDMLILRGEKRAEIEDEDRRYSERSYGRFERRLSLPAEVDEDRVSASFKKGVLTVVLPKTERARSRAKRIPISGATDL